MTDPADKAKRAIKAVTRATDKSLTEAHDAAMKAAATLHCDQCNRHVPAVAYVIGIGKVCSRCYKEPVRPKRGPLRDFLERIAAKLARRWAKRYPGE